MNWRYLQRLTTEQIINYLERELPQIILSKKSVLNYERNIIIEKLQKKKNNSITMSKEEHQKLERSIKRLEYKLGKANARIRRNFG